MYLFISLLAFFGCVNASIIVSDSPLLANSTLMNNATCSWEATGDIFRGMTLALQKNTTDLESDCFLNSNLVVDDVEGLIRSVEDLIIYWSTDEEELPDHL